MSEKTPQVKAFWAAFKAAAGIGHDRYDVVAFGDSPEMADELADLVINGPKRATAGSGPRLRPRRRADAGSRRTCRLSSTAGARRSASGAPRM